MKKTVLLCAAALLVGLVLGFAGGHSLLFGAGQLSRNSDTPANTAISALMPSTPLPSPTVQALDTQDNLPLLERGGQVLLALRDRDYAALAQLTHPTAGVTFTPYSTVTREYDLVFTPQQLAGLGEDTTVYTWGVIDGKGDPIRMTGEEYISSYVFNADYTQAPQIGVDTIHLLGNALENVAAAFPDGRFVEYHFPGLDPQMEGYDWCSLKVVFEAYNNQWYLVGLIHSQWTI